MSRLYNEDYIPKETSNLNNNSKIMIIQLRILDKKKILNKIGSIKDNKISNKIDKVIR
jgi:mRNA interferase MazF